MITPFFRISLTIISLILVFNSCQNPQESQREPDRQQVREGLLGANVMLIDAEDQEIKDFIERHGWNMQETGSGLRYMIYEKGDGPRAETGNIAVFHYSIRLITGDLVYSSHDQDMAEFRIGRGGVESGLEEGILLLHAGDKARFIMPSHLAHGVPGDGTRIPKRATIIYDIELVELR